MNETADARDTSRRRYHSADKMLRIVPASVRALILAGLLLLALGPSAELASAGAGSGSYWPSVSPTLVVSGLNRPVHVTHAGDGSGRLFVVEKAGVIKIIDNGAMLATPFLDISSRVGSGGSEQGLLSVAFPPDYATLGEFYVNYTDTNGKTVVARYTVTANPDVADSTSEEIIRIVDQPYANHNGGQLAFGPNDGYLYIGMGDGGSGGDPQDNAQNPDTLLGKLLRVDVAAPTYAIPPDNPFTAGNDPGDVYRDEIWALGLRNPWRFSFDRLTHDLYIADVGQGAWEEINFQAASSAGGENYGWRCYEGNHTYNTSGCGDQSLYVFPVHEYSHTDGNHSVTGGFVSRGKNFPHMWGIYFYADYSSGRIWGLRRSGSGWENSLLHDAGYQISSFGEDEAGNLYIAKYAGSPDGAIYKLEDTSMELCDADYDGSGTLDAGDYAVWTPAWGAEDGDSDYAPTKDPIYDGIIRVDDFVWAGQYLGEPCS